MKEILLRKWIGLQWHWYLLCWFVRDEHTKTATSPEGQQLLVYGDMGPWRVITTALENYIVPQLPHRCKNIGAPSLFTSGTVIKTECPNEEVESPLTHDTPVEGAS